MNRPSPFVASLGFALLTFLVSANLVHGDTTAPNASDTNASDTAIASDSASKSDSGDEADSSSETVADGLIAADDIAAGHSKHGEVFNEGPRQQAYLMHGTGKIKFEVKSENPLVQKFVEQGVGQLHGFWFFEAERSFRQAAMLDPNCAIAYWGMARANENNKERAKELIERAFELIDHASPREEMYILSLHEFLTSAGEKEKNKAKKKREAAYVEAVEKIVEEFPKDLEAKALLGYVLYKYRSSADRTQAEVDVILDQVLAKEKNHPVHHYRIHIWDQKSPQRALDSAAKCGPAAEGIAHMWHMCGHIFSRVKRFGDAAWFQEASARVDHRHMMHDMVLPDQTHNFAHNNEWLIRNLMNVGRVREAIDLAKNMIELPRHPKYNMLDKRNSASYGRDRLMNVLERFELWDEAISLSEGAYLEPTEDHEEQLKRLRLLGKSYAKTDQLAAAHDIVDQLETKLDELKADAPKKEDIAVEEQADNDEAEEDKPDTSVKAEASDKAKTDAKADEAEDSKDGEEKDSQDKDDDKKNDNKAEKKREKEFKKKQDAHDRKVERMERDIACVTGYIALARGETEEALTLLDKADEDGLSKARVRVLTGDPEQAVKDAVQHAKDRKKQVQPLAGLIEISWAAGDRSQAAESFVKLRAISNWIDMASPVFTRLEPIAKELGYGNDWRIRLPGAEDLGKQPELATLGPFRWQPTPAPNWLLPDSDGNLHSLEDYRGRPVIMVFYLGFGCLHCAEQLQALAPKTEEFAEMGISLIAVSSDNLDGLLKSQENYDGDKMPFPLVANPKHDIFKAYRAFDDFEDLPLHGTYLIDGKGRVRWQDISYDPFMDVDFLLKESKRLLSQGKPAVTETGELAQSSK